MGIAGLLIGTVAGVVDACQPATVQLISQPAGQPSESLCCKINIASAPEQLPQDVHVKHPGGDPGVDRAR